MKSLGLFARIVGLLPLQLLFAVVTWGQIPECPITVSGSADVYMVAIYAHGSSITGQRYTYQTPTYSVKDAVLTPCPCEGYPIGFEWFYVPPDFSKSTPVLVTSCGDTEKVYPRIFNDGFESGNTWGWSRTVP